MTAAQNSPPSTLVAMTLKDQGPRALSQVLCPSWRPLQLWQGVEQPEPPQAPPPPRQPTQITRETQPTRLTARESLGAAVLQPAVCRVWSVWHFPLISQGVSSTRSLFGFLPFHPFVCEQKICWLVKLCFQRNFISGSVVPQSESWSEQWNRETNQRGRAGFHGGVPRVLPRHLLVG